MTVFIPTARVRIERLTAAGVDQYGDETATNTIVASGVPVTITEIKQRSYQSTESRGGQVEEFTVRFRPAVTVQEGDRLVNQVTGEAYRVQTVRHSPGVVGLADVRVTAVQVGAVSVP